MSRETSFDLIEALYNSLTTIKEMLDSRGYNTESMPKFSPVEIRAAASVNLSTMNFTVPKKDDAEFTASVRFGDVSRTAYDNIASEIEDSGKKQEIIYIIPEQIQQWHHLMARKLYAQTKVLVAFFSCHYISTNPTKHILVPKHEILSKEQSKEILKNLYAKKAQLPIIVFHEDVQARYLGARPGDIVHIERPSPSSGVYSVYRICA